MTRPVDPSSDRVDQSNPAAGSEPPGSLFGSYQSDPGPSKRRGRVIAAGAGLLILIAAIILVVVLKRKGAGADSDDTQPIVSVSVAKAEKKPIAAKTRAVGTIFPIHQATVAAKINAQIKEMALVKNKPVKAGQVIAVLETRDIRSQRAEAAAALDEALHNQQSLSTGAIPQAAAQDEKAFRDATANVTNTRAVLERRKKLYENGAISLKDLESSQLAFDAAENDLRLARATSSLHKSGSNPNDLAAAAARVAQAREKVGEMDAQLGYAKIAAPIDGVITDQFQYQGDFAQTGNKLFVVSDVSRVIVKAPFADTVAASLQVGDKAEVRPSDGSGEPIAGNISLVSRAGDPTSRAFEVWVELANPGGRLRAGAAAEVTIASREAVDSVIVPTSAVTLDATNGDKGTVMVVDDQSVAHETKVTIGIRTSESIQILSGLKGGETVVVEGNYALPDGTTVKAGEHKSGADEPEAGDKD